MTMSDEDSERRRDEAKAAYKALPPIKRIEHWGVYTVNWPIAEAFQALGVALNEWAKEQQKGS